MLTNTIFNPSLISKYWYTAEEINRLLHLQLKDSQEAHIYSAHFPFIQDKLGQSAAALLQETLYRCLQDTLPSVIPLNCVEQAALNEYGLPQNPNDLVGNHWIGLVIQPQGNQSYYLTLIDSLGNGLHKDKEISGKNLFEIQAMVAERHPNYKGWERTAILKGLLEGLIQDKKLTVKLKFTVTGLAQQQDGSSCGPFLVTNLCDWLKRGQLYQYDPMRLRQQHAQLLQNSPPTPLPTVQIKLNKFASASLENKPNEDFPLSQKPLHKSELYQLRVERMEDFVKQALEAVTFIGDNKIATHQALQEYLRRFLQQIQVDMSAFTNRLTVSP